MWARPVFAHRFPRANHRSTARERYRYVVDKLRVVTRRLAKTILRSVTVLFIARIIEVN